MKLTIELPEVDTIIKSCVLGSFFMEIKDPAKLLTELAESEDGAHGELSVSELEHGIVAFHFDNLRILEMWNLVEGEAQFLRNYILELAVV